MQLMYVEYVYKLCKGSAVKTAKILDMDRKTLYRWLKLLDNNNFLKKDKLQ
jgi:transcriptional regulator of acetoin/glycerol metabolism